MGTYTANYNLYMPTVGEQGWGDLMNGNLTTIDTTMKSLSNRITAVENEVNGNLSCTSVTTSSTITSTGLITANGGVKGNVTGNVQGLLFVKGTVGTSGDENYATLAAQTWGPDVCNDKNNPKSITINNYSIVYGNPKRHTHGVYTRRSDLTGTLNPSASTRTLVFKQVDVEGQYYNFGNVYWRYSGESSWNSLGEIRAGSSLSVTVSVGKTVQFYVWAGSGYPVGVQVTVNAGTTYKVKYATP